MRHDYMTYRAYLIGFEGEPKAAAINRQAIVDQERGQRLILRIPPGGARQKLDLQAILQSENLWRCQAILYHCQTSETKRHSFRQVGSRVIAPNEPGTLVIAPKEPGTLAGGET